MTSSSDERLLEEASFSSSGGSTVPVSLTSAALMTEAPMGRNVVPCLVSNLNMKIDKDSPHDPLVSSTSNFPASGVQCHDTDAASVLLYQSCNSGKDPRLWNVQEVSSFMLSIGCSNYADAFTKEVHKALCADLASFIELCYV